MLDTTLLSKALDGIEALRSELFDARQAIDPAHPRYATLLNLRHYRILRQKDRTTLQEHLSKLALSSLGRSYAHVAASVDTLYDQLQSALGAPQLSLETMQSFHHLTIDEATAIATRNTVALLGGKEHKRQHTAIMVTLPSYAIEHEGTLITELARAGVTVFRINTAHDNATIWRTIAQHIATLNQSLPPERQCKIFVDLAGPKIRTGKIRRLTLPIEMGSNKRPKTILLYAQNAPTQGEIFDPVSMEKSKAQLCTDAKFFATLEVGARIKVIDTNAKAVHLTITHIDETKATAILDKKVYVDETSTLKYQGKKGTVRNVATQIEPIRLFPHDHLILTEEELLGHAATYDERGELLEPASISTSLKGLARFAKAGQSLFIDDGKIGLVVLEVSENALLCEVVQAKKSGELLKEEKGINLPDAHLDIDAVTTEDVEHLLACIDFADMFGLSFCQTPKDVERLRTLLESNGKSDTGIVAKIETRDAVANMPAILEALLACPKSGVMIARGDLAIEVGFRNLASVQERLLDICDAAHMPVIWATQVLESQMKTNLPSRAEVTDAAMAGRAECVMLNKGPFAIDTIDVLVHILHDMHDHFKKNRQLLTQERLW
ncbi:MAG: hypothetical protein KU37_07130 [Sulfuricurvum sp. PC08-66]|nr:MAG: hypothetical protein KU37_07130 [Sulfuricurvum sp. PC08-66]